MQPCKPLTVSFLKLSFKEKRDRKQSKTAVKRNNRQSRSLSLCLNARSSNEMK